MKTGILITGRLKSTRLKEKAIKEIQGRPMFSHMLDRLKLSRFGDEIILCTSTDPQDDRLCELADSEGINYYRGDPDDVLARMLGASNQYGIDTIVSCTADNPFVDPFYIDKLVNFHNKMNNDFTQIKGLPWGTFSYALRRAAVEKACLIKDDTDTETWGGYFTQTGQFKCDFLQVEDKSVLWPDLRLTVDTQEDFDLVSSIFEELKGLLPVFELSDIVKLCREKPELLDINKNVVQKMEIPISVKST